MKFNALMHVNIRVKDWDKMIDFYQNKLGLKAKVIVKYKEYLHSDNRQIEKEFAQKDPEKVMYGYFEVTPGQFIEMLPAMGNEQDDVEWNSRLGLNHFALTVNDIQKTYQEFKAKDIPVLGESSKGPAGTWKFWSHDPENNYFEVMQYTKDSYQVNGHVDE
ncbi:glyoxalase/bleomycin resistance/dioxygenase family protein [Lactobacillus taiwanensis]|uniref:VOC family protein n=1 Tax=Lactobacillus taiwanensis TaxID=508451 RepID=UPI000B98E07A|nr:VOC family protein [Lactobacillus taiwanensis]OYS21730.1 glyoxalase/bleomycin resistance/dioxygenase family protein [Lactobacillus taiwanensis]OYS23576.1 glyoxalase/bleomycin resistance/dioxygenase family protein [Lactobacillus taiwanensis]OYS25487.1 glyoxalase/bleomycin resistance/dioxygenase family protein [Lactobacillus taiwanensis]OYS25827.1 glyoxalase/bleomycin resistance/dioxygenase family protein [Lactobacillus taiwanensis]OYS27840.1 glyoxalase/bleomycin resistance/dioxygenase family